MSHDFRHWTQIISNIIAHYKHYIGLPPSAPFRIEGEGGGERERERENTNSDGKINEMCSHMRSSTKSTIACTMFTSLDVSAIRLVRLWLLVTLIESTHRQIGEICEAEEMHQPTHTHTNTQT